MQDIELFMSFCYDVADEKFDLSVLDGFGEGNLTLYHASPMKLDVIEPTSWNMGNRLSPKKRKSSFWTKNINYSILWSLDWIMLRIESLPYIHDIEKYKFYVPDIKIEELKDGVVIAQIPILKWMMDQLKEEPVYIYQATVPRAIVSKGQFNIEEYTIDVPVTPEKKITVTEKMTKDVIELMPADAFLRLLKTDIGNTKKKHPSIKERFIYRNPRRVTRMRKRHYKKEYKSYGHAPSPQLASESFFGM